MRTDKEKAIKLRKKGLSYKQIVDVLSIPKSTLSYWLKDLDIGKEARDRINKRAIAKSREALINRNKEQTQKAKERADKILAGAEKEFSKMRGIELFIVGISLYWAEGYKKGAEGSKWKTVDFANSDPRMVALMMRFFREICSVADSKFRVQVIAHSGLDIDEAVNYWSRQTNIPTKQFYKTSIGNVGRGIKRRGNILTNGTVHIRISDVELFFRIIGWIKGLKSSYIIGD